MKQALLIVILAQFLIPSLSYGASLKELEARLNDLEDELLIAQEENKDFTKEIDNSIKLSGYVDIEYISSSLASQKDSFRMHHTSLFFEKRLSERLHFFSEVEYEDAPKFEAEGKGKPFKAQEGKIFLEAVNLSYLLNSKTNFRLGRFYTPAGIWSVDHYPAFVPTQERPQHIRRIFPQLVDGAMVYGTLPFLGETFLNYDIYTGNGEGNVAKKDSNDDKAYGIKTSLLLPYMKHFEIGTTYYTDVLNDKTEKTATGFHSKIKAGNVTLQLEYSEGEEELAGAVTNSEGYYAQLVYGIGKYTLGIRHDFYDNDTSAASKSTKYGTVNALFANYHVNENVVVKLEHHLIEVEDTTSEKYNKTLLSVVAYLGN